MPLYHEDSYALDVLANVLADGKSTPFYKVIVEEQELAPAVFASNGSQELAGRFTIADPDLCGQGPGRRDGRGGGRVRAF